jgi:hypothetical protein
MDAIIIETGGVTVIAQHSTEQGVAPQGGV